VVDRRIDPHRHLIRVFAGDALVHLDEVPVALLDRGAPEAGDRVAEVEVHAVLQRSDPPARVHLALRGTRRDVARDEVAEGGVAPLEEVVAVLRWDLVGWSLIAELLG